MSEIFSPLTLALTIGAIIFFYSYKIAPRVMEYMRWQSIGTRDYIVERLGLMFIEATPNQVLGGMIATSAVPALLIFLICYFIIFNFLNISKISINDQKIIYRMNIIIDIIIFI